MAACLILLAAAPVAFGVEFNAPRQLEVPAGARPIWTPARPTAPAVQTTPVSGPSSARFVGAAGLDSTGTTVASTSALRWRSRNEPATDAQPSVAWRADDQWRNANSPTVQARPIQTVGHNEDRTAFADPFGDRLAQADDAAPEAPMLEGPGADGTTFVPLDENAPAPPPTFNQPAPGTFQLPPVSPDFGGNAPSENPDAPAPPGVLLDDEAPGLSIENMLPDTRPGTIPAPRSDDDGEAAPAPSAWTPPPATPRGDSFPDSGYGANLYDQRPDCDRIYGENERNCCSDQEKCNATRALLRTNPISNVSLDITAPFQPDTDDANAQRQARLEQLGRIPARVWRDRDGQSVADGRLTDLRYRRAIISESDGTVREIPLKNLSDDDLCFLAAWWGVPTECSLGDDKYVGRNWTPVTFSWKASGLCHKPLYFEEVQLERYGHTTGPVLQPALSGAHFFLNVAVLPYKMGINPPNECQYSLGYYRPGSCAPWLLPPVPISLRGGLAQAGAVTGMVFLFP